MHDTFYAWTVTPQKPGPLGDRSRGRNTRQSGKQSNGRGDTKRSAILARFVRSPGRRKVQSTASLTESPSRIPRRSKRGATCPDRT